MQDIKKLNDVISTQKPLYTFEVKTGKNYYFTAFKIIIWHVKHNNFISKYYKY